MWILIFMGLLLRKYDNWNYYDNWNSLIEINLTINITLQLKNQTDIRKLILEKYNSIIHSIIE